MEEAEGQKHETFTITPTSGMNKLSPMHSLLPHFSADFGLNSCKLALSLLHPFQTRYVDRNAVQKRKKNQLQHAYEFINIFHTHVFAKLYAYAS